MDVVEGVDGGAHAAHLAPAGRADVRGLGAGRGSRRGRAGDGACYGSLCHGASRSVLVRGSRGGAGGAGAGVEDDEAATALEL